MPQSIHRKKGGGINEREPSAFIAYTYDSKTMPPCKMQSAKQKVLDEITGFARSRHPVKVYCYQWTTSNFLEKTNTYPCTHYIENFHCRPTNLNSLSKLTHYIIAAPPCQPFSQTFPSLLRRKLPRLCWK